MKPITYKISDLKNMILRGAKKDFFMIGDILYLRLNFLNIRMEDEIRIISISDGKYYCEFMRSYQYDDFGNITPLPTNTFHGSTFFLKKDVDVTIFKRPLY